MADPIKPTAAQIDAVLYQMATFQDGNAQPHTIALINEMADLLQAFALHAQQAREEADARIAELENVLREIETVGEWASTNWMRSRARTTLRSNPDAG